MLQSYKYDAESDYKVPADAFSPVSVPLEEYIRLPEGYNVHFIDSEEKVSMMKVLIGQKYIGVDAEWRPERPSWGIMGNGPSIL